MIGRRQPAAGLFLRWVAALVGVLILGSLPTHAALAAATSPITGAITAGPLHPAPQSPGDSALLSFHGRPGEYLAGWVGTPVWAHDFGVAAKGVPEVANEGIYVVRNAAGDVYVGQSGNITARLLQHVSNGKFTQAEVDAAERIGVSGGKTAREIAEQLKLDSLGGKKAPNVINEINPIGDRRLDLMPPGYARP